MQRDTLSLPISGTFPGWGPHGPKAPGMDMGTPRGHPALGGQRAELPAHSQGKCFTAALWVFSRAGFMVKAHQCTKGCVLLLDCLSLVETDNLVNLNKVSYNYSFLKSGHDLLCASSSLPGSQRGSYSSAAASLWEQPVHWSSREKTTLAFNKPCR